MDILDRELLAVETRQTQSCFILFILMSSNLSPLTSQISLCLWLQGRPRLSCHVCYASYQDYKTYFRHLISNSCVKHPTVDKSLLKSSLTIYAPSSAAEVRSFPLSDWERDSHPQAATLSLINSTSLLAEDSSSLKFKNILKRANPGTPRASVE